MFKKILIVTSFYEEEVAYQEVELANFLQKEGRDVTVLTSTHSMLKLKTKSKSGTSKIKIIRLENVFRLKDTIFPKASIKKMIHEIDPDLAILIYPGAGLPYFAMKSFSNKVKVVSFFGDLEVKDKAGAATTYKGNIVVKTLLKNPWYRAVLKRSDVIVSNTNETTDIIKRLSKENIDDKEIMPGLGYNPENYFYDEEARRSVRDEFKVKDKDILLITVTRMYSAKPLMKWFKPVVEALKKDKNLHYIIAGFTNDEYPNKIKSLLQEEGIDRFHLLNFSDVKRNNAMFSAADYSIWFAPTISIQQSMGTGLPAIMPFDKTLDHIAEEGYNGKYYTELSDIPALLDGIKQSELSRNELAKFNERFSYRAILKKIFDKVEAVVR